MPATDARPRRILVIANETLPGERLRSELAGRGALGESEVFLVCPALSTRLNFIMSDRTKGIDEAQARLDATMESLRRAGVEATGQIGDTDPLLAIEDGLRQFAADELLIATHPPERSNWLEKRVVERARERFDLPLTHLVVDLEAEQATQPRVA